MPNHPRQVAECRLDLFFGFLSESMSPFQVLTLVGQVFLLLLFAPHVAGDFFFMWLWLQSVTAGSEETEYTS